MQEWRGEWGQQEEGSPNHDSLLIHCVPKCIKLIFLLYISGGVLGWGPPALCLHTACVCVLCDRYVTVCAQTVRVRIL